MEEKAQRDPCATDGASPAPFSVSFLVLEGFSMLALSSAVEPLRALNRLTGEERYVWTVVGERAGPVAAGNGIEIGATCGVREAPPCDLWVVVASLSTELADPGAVFERLRRIRAERRLLGAVSNGTLILAQAGVLGDRRVTIHWEMQRRLAEAFPELEVRPDLYCWDRGVLSAAGGTAALDMFLALIAERDGHSAAAEVSDQFLHGPVRPSTEMQRQDVRWRYQVTDRRLVTVIRIMEEHQSDPMRICRIADTAGISERQLERLFVSEFGKSPSDFYMDIRLKTAQRWLLNSTESLERISEISGFSSLAHFSRSFKAWSGLSPSVLRKRHRGKNDGNMQEVDVRA
ncbi:HTH-type transcriptional regulator CdhR [Paralimibaculum aggregatum]|uniref:HTH-type transcriptional regulator CdhR n=1 Tax=Paralimibaculum aggregatum TaxID=3036245 RepID=A0ABQ6LEI7_9RHOB|nr:GlxA family transcriptional regulator [Limibaculum sp. NKW23]GMG81752.1 HTH-type transcriptional regulator CdhR [Limibaculum sp. NKW23]